MAKKELSTEEKWFIHNIIGPQLQKSEKVNIPTNALPAFNIEYCAINNGDPRSFIDVIVLMTGFLSGWTGIAKLGYELAKLGHQVYMISMPGYGNSDDPIIPYYVINEKIWSDIEALKDFACKVLAGRKIHWVGHSMGAEIITRFACEYPKLTESITLLNPSGFEKRNMIALGLKFVANGIIHNRKFRDDPVWEELKKFLPKEESSLTLNRLPQRIREWKRCCSNIALEAFQKIPDHIPWEYITGEKDFVFPIRDSALFNSWVDMDDAEYYPFNIIKDAYHNTTMFGSERTAAEIHKFISGIK